MNVIVGNLSTFTVFQGHIFWSRSCQGQINIAQYVYCDVSNMKVINIMVIEILQKRSNFDISLLCITFQAS